MDSPPKNFFSLPLKSHKIVTSTPFGKKLHRFDTCPVKNHLFRLIWDPLVGKQKEQIIHMNSLHIVGSFIVFYPTSSVWVLSRWNTSKILGRKSTNQIILVCVCVYFLMLTHTYTYICKIPRRQGVETWMSIQVFVLYRKTALKYIILSPKPHKLWLRNKNLIQDKKREALDMLPSTG